MSDIKPFLGFSAPRTTRAFADALDAVDTAIKPSPWSVKAPVAPTFDTDAIFADARARGREEGLAETAELRARLKSLVDQLTNAQAKTGPKIADLVADAACTVIEAWSQTAKKEIFTTVIEAWTQSALGAATARVNPIDAALIGDAMPVETDDAINPGDIFIRGGSAELAQRWQDRLGELRETIIAAVEEAK